jgi:DNA mismatch endonuclease (patch repair protein)
MSDSLTKEERSARMSRIGSKNTGPEMEVRRLLRSLGYGYRLHRRDLPGSPDITFVGRRKVIFVHGCFWHRHPDPNCKLARLPKSRLEFWLPKLEANAHRDEIARARLTELGWKSLVIWECQLRDRALLESTIRSFLDHEVD